MDLIDTTTLYTLRLHTCRCAIEMNNHTQLAKILASERTHADIGGEQPGIVNFRFIQFASLLLRTAHMMQSIECFTCVCEFYVRFVKRHNISAAEQYSCLRDLSRDMDTTHDVHYIVCMAHKNMIGINNHLVTRAIDLLLVADELDVPLFYTIIACGYEFSTDQIAHVIRHNYLGLVVALLKKANVDDVDVEAAFRFCCANNFPESGALVLERFSEFRTMLVLMMRMAAACSSGYAMTTTLNNIISLRDAMAQVFEAEEAIVAVENPEPVVEPPVQKSLRRSSRACGAPKRMRLCMHCASYTQCTC